jgi:hypothetical protein
MRLCHFRLIERPIKTRSATIVALFGVVFEPVHIKDIRLLRGIDGAYSIAFSNEGRCGRVVIFEPERAALLAAAVSAFERRVSKIQSRLAAPELGASEASAG